MSFSSPSGSTEKKNINLQFLALLFNSHFSEDTHNNILMVEPLIITPYATNNFLKNKLRIK